MTLENEYLRVGVSTLGAELNSLYDKTLGRELLWQPNPNIWNAQAPLLFPVVGGLNGGLRWQGRHYPLQKHGFALSSPFQPLTGNRMRLESSAQTKRVYPFDFSLELAFTLENRSLITAYTVQNTGDESLFFSLGAHPGFALDGDLEDYFIEFPETTRIECRHRIENEVLVPDMRRWEGRRLPISKEIFEKDAIILENLSGNWAALSHRARGELIRVLWDEHFSVLGLWAKPSAPFLCIEPCAGIDDRFDFSGDISQKKGIIPLPAGQSKTLSYTIQIKE